MNTQYMSPIWKRMVKMCWMQTNYLQFLYIKTYSLKILKVFIEEKGISRKYFASIMTLFLAARHNTRLI